MFLAAALGYRPAILAASASRFHTVKYAEPYLVWLGIRMIRTRNADCPQGLSLLLRGVGGPSHGSAPSQDRSFLSLFHPAIYFTALGHNFSAIPDFCAVVGPLNTTADLLGRHARCSLGYKLKASAALRQPSTDRLRLGHDRPRRFTWPLPMRNED